MCFKIKKLIKDIIRNIIGEKSTRSLIKKGLKVGKNFNREQGCFIDPSHCFLIEIGDNVTFSIRVTLLAHDASTKKINGYTKFGKIVIKNNAFIGANTTILPNVIIGENSIIGAGSVVTKNIPDNCVAAGNPAKVLYSLEDYKIKVESKRKEKNTFDSRYTMREKLGEDMKRELINITKEGIGFVE